MRVLMVTTQMLDGKHSLTMAPAMRQIDSLRAAGAEIDVLQVAGLPKLKYLQTIPKLILLARRADIIHGHYAFCGWLARLIPGKPIVVSFMGDDLLGTPDLNGKVIPTSRVVVGASRWLARCVDSVIVKSAEMARVVAPVDAHVIPNGVDLTAFAPMDPCQARQRLGWAEGTKYVLFPGNPGNPRKGHAFATACIAQVRSQLATSTVELVPLWNVKPEQVPLYLNASDVMLMASYIEGSPNVVKEALACNLPVVSVPVGDVEEMLSGVDGCRVCERDPVVVGTALVETLVQGRRSSGRVALQRRGLDLASVAGKILSIYEELIAARRNSTRQETTSPMCGH